MKLSIVRNGHWTKEALAFGFGKRRINEDIGEEEVLENKKWIPIRSYEKKQVVK